MLRAPPGPAQRWELQRWEEKKKISKLQRWEEQSDGHDPKEPREGNTLRQKTVLLPMVDAFTVIH